MKGEKITVKNAEEIKKEIKKEKNPKTKIKLIFLNFVSFYPNEFENICELCGVATSTGYQWIRAWNEKGYESIKEKENKGGRPPKLSKEDLEHLKEKLNEKDHWVTKEVKGVIKQEFNVELSDDQIVRILKEKMKMHFSKPFPVDYRRPENAEEILDNQLKLTFSLLEEKNIKKEEIAIGFIDETSPQNTSNTVRVWSFGKPKCIKNTTKFKTNTIGFYAIKGESVKDFMVDSKKESVASFLEEIRKANQKYKAIVVVLDNFRSHTSKLVKDKAKELGIYLVFLPRYSPDLNPIEYIWKSIKRTLSKEFIKHIEHMKEHITRQWNTLSKRLSFAKAWISKFLSGDYAWLCG